MAAAIHTFPIIEDESEAEYDRDYREAQTPQRDATPTNTFGMVPVSLYGLVDHGAVAVYAAIASHAKPNGYASPSIDTITKLIKTISRPTVMKHVKALADAGAIVITEHRRGSTRSYSYFLPLHPPVKKLDRSAIIDSLTGQESLPATGQKTLPVESEKTLTGQESLPVPVKDFDRNKKERVNANDDARGRRFTEADVLTDAYREAAIAVDFPLSRVVTEFAEFKDYWIGATGQNAVKRDWVATFRNHLRRQFTRQRISPVPGQSLSDASASAIIRPAHWNLPDL